MNSQTRLILVDKDETELEGTSDTLHNNDMSEASDEHDLYGEIDDGDVVDQESGALHQESDVEQETDGENVHHDFSDLVYPGATISRKNFVNLLLIYVLTNKITGKSLNDLLQLLNTVFPNVIPKSQYLFFKNFEVNDLEIHFYCTGCSEYFGPDPAELTECQTCGELFNKDESLKQGNVFYYHSLIKQLKLIIRNVDVAPNVCEISSLYDEYGQAFGKTIQEMLQSGAISHNDILLTWNFDGAQVFKSSQKSLWPFQMCLQNLPPQLQKRHMLLPALWIGKSKPGQAITEAILQPILRELKILQETGVVWKKNNRNSISSKVFAVNSVCDSPARAMVCNSKQFNGEYGCTWCYHPGKWVSKGGGGTRAYCFDLPEPESRSQELWVNDAVAAKQTNTVVKGVKGLSPLLDMPLYSIVEGAVPDIMHSVFLGVVRQFLSLWLDSVNHEKEWYIGRNIDQMNVRLLQIKPPSEITRIPRSLRDRHFWKANELRNFIAYYSVIVLHSILPQTYLNHWLLLVYSVINLLQERTSEATLQNIDFCLKKFVLKTEELYGTEQMSFNLHSLTHLVDTARRWGSLGAVSAFVFESNMHVLLQFFHGTQHVSLQVMKRYIYYQIMLGKMQKAPETVSTLAKKMLRQLPMHTQNAREFEHIVLFGKGKWKALSASQQITIMSKFPTCHDLYMGQFYQRCYSKISNTVFTVDEYNESRKRCNSVCLIRDTSQLFVITAFICLASCHLFDNYNCNNAANNAKCNCDLIPIIYGRKLNKNRQSLAADTNVPNPISTINICPNVVEVEGDLILDCETFLEKCVMIKCENEKYVTPVLHLSAMFD